MGLSHESVVKAARKLGLQVQAQVNAGYGLPIVDLALQRDDGSKVAVQVRVLGFGVWGLAFRRARIIRTLCNVQQSMLMYEYELQTVF